MLNLFLSETADNSGAATGNSWWIYVVLIVMVVLMLVLPSITNRRRMKEYNQMLDQLRVGDKVRTIGGIIGRVTKISTKGDVKSFTLETGAKGSKTTMEFDMAAVGTVLESTYVAPAAEPETKKTDKKAKAEAKEETAEVEDKVENAEPVSETEAKAEETSEAPAAEETTAAARETKAESVSEDVVLAKKKTTKKAKK